MRLLVIDDSRLDRKKIRRLAAQMKDDVEVAEAHDVATALGMVAVERFDCILIDYRLPGSDGIELAQEIERNHGGLKTPLIMLTGEPTADLARRAISSGIDDFIGKNTLSAEHLRQALCNVMIKHQAQQARQEPAAEGGGIADLRLATGQAIALLSRSPAFQDAMAADADVADAMALMKDAVAKPD
jgi:CheY-like chemotaxis protein